MCLRVVPSLLKRSCVAIADEVPFSKFPYRAPFQVHPKSERKSDECDVGECPFADIALRYPLDIPDSCSARATTLQSSARLAAKCRSTRRDA